MEMKLIVEPYPKRGRKTLKKVPRKRVKPIKYPKVLEALQKAVVRKLYGNDCYTCPAQNLQGSNCQLGHVPWPRSQLSTICKFDYEYTRMQCFKCNIWNKGCGADAYRRMVSEDIDVEAMHQQNLATKGKVCGKPWFETKIAEYKQVLSS